LVLRRSDQASAELLVRADVVTAASCWRALKDLRLYSEIVWRSLIPFL